jgi:hypothetical protein
MRVRRSLAPGLLVVTASLLLAAPVAAAKGAKTGDVSGTVRYKGKPLPGGTITFHPAKGKPIVARIKKDGSFAAKGVPVGETHITVETESLRPKSKDCEAGKNVQKDKDKKRAKKLRGYVRIPAMYADREKSGLQKKVLKGKQTFDLYLR